MIVSGNFLNVGEPERTSEIKSEDIASSNLLLLVARDSAAGEIFLALVTS